jgi:hypothetical protein
MLNDSKPFHCLRVENKGTDFLFPLLATKCSGGKYHTKPGSRLVLEHLNLLTHTPNKRQHTMASTSYMVVT